MTPENDQKLVSTFPHLYADRNKSAQETCMHWGFSCEDGWFDIVWRVSEKLEKIIVDWIAKNPGSEKWPRAAQVKEKFGGLRFYLKDGTEEMRAAIREAEVEASKTCEECGKPGELRKNGYMFATLCDSCDEKKKTGKR